MILGREDEETEGDLPKKPDLELLTQIAEKVNSAMYNYAKRNKVTQQLLASNVSYL